MLPNWFEFSRFSALLQARASIIAGTRTAVRCRTTFAVERTIEFK